jgi:ferrochelatase
MARTGVVLTNLGAPDSPAEIEPFLRALFSDPLILSIRPGPLRRLVARRIARKRAPKVARDYERIGGSPLRRLTEEQAAALDRVLERREPTRFAVAVAMRYSRPSSEDALRALVARGCDRFVHLPLYPQESRATTESSSRALREALADVAPKAPLVEVRSYHLHPGYVGAVRRTVEEGLLALRAAGAEDPVVLFTAHGLPRRFERAGDPYVGQVRATREAVARGLSVPTHLSFQSRVGPVRWVRPYTDETVRRLAREGTRSLLFVPLGFVSDHFETLFEIDLLYAGLARELGVEHVARAPSLGTRADFLEALAGLATSRS